MLRAMLRAIVIVRVVVAKKGCSLYSFALFVYVDI